MCSFFPFILAQIPGPSGLPAWVTPAVALGAPLVILLITEYFRRRTTHADGNTGVQIAQLQGMAQIRSEEAKARHDLRDEFNARVLRLTNKVEHLQGELQRTQDGFRELYYVRQREWDHWETWLDLLKRDNPQLVLQEDKIPHRLDTAHLAPFRMFQPMPELDPDRP